MQTEDKLLSRQQLLDGLAWYSGHEESAFRHWSGAFVYSEGTQFLADKARAYWLIDLIAMRCSDDRIKGQAFVHWKLTVAEDRTAVLIADNANGGELLRETVAHIDFSLDEITLYLVDETLQLPREY